MKVIRIFALLLVIVIMLAACGDNNTDFPTVPDKIIIGADGKEIEFLPGSEEFDEIYSYICGRIEKSGKFDFALLDAHDYITGEHLSTELRESETFVEFLYDEISAQSFLMSQSGNGTVTKDIEVKKLFFPLSGEYHDCFFVGNDAEYKSESTLGILIDDTSLTTYVRELVTGETNDK